MNKPSYSEKSPYFAGGTKRIPIDEPYREVAGIPEQHYYDPYEFNMWLQQPTTSDNTDTEYDRLIAEINSPANGDTKQSQDNSPPIFVGYQNFSVNPSSKADQQKQGNIVIGISLANSFFNEQNLEGYITWALENTTSEILIVIADGLGAINQQIIYESPIQVARNKATKLGLEKAKQLHTALNKISSKDRHRIHIIRWQNLAQQPDYQHNLKEIHDHFNHDEVFRNDVHTCARSMSFSDENWSKRRRDFACIYILHELAAFLVGFSHNGQQFFDRCIYPKDSSMWQLITELQKGAKYPKLSANLIRRAHMTVQIVNDPTPLEQDTTTQLQIRSITRHLGQLLTNALNGTSTQNQSTIAHIGQVDIGAIKQELEQRKLSMVRSEIYWLASRIVNLRLEGVNLQESIRRAIDDTIENKKIRKETKVTPRSIWSWANPHDWDTWESYTTTGAAVDKEVDWGKILRNAA